MKRLRKLGSIDVWKNDYYDMQTIFAAVSQWHCEDVKSLMQVARGAQMWRRVRPQRRPRKMNYLEWTVMADQQGLACL